jgi:hypothetical protein
MYINTPGIIIADPNKHLTSITSTSTGPYTTSTGSNSTSMLYEVEISFLKDRVTRLERQLDMSNIAILAALKKFTKEECDNIKKMLESNDPASVELAKTIIEESLCQ